MQMRWSLPLAFSLTLAACANAPTAPEPAAAPPAAAVAPAVPALSSGLILDNFDKSVRPQDDLYRFVNGTWLAKTEIPADKSNYGSFTKLADGAEANLRVIADEAAAAEAAVGSDQQLIGDFYSSFMDEAAAEQHGMAPLKSELERIDAVKDRKQLLEYLARAQMIVVSNPIAAYIQPDAKRPDVYTIYADQSGLGMPERDYYLSKDARFTEIRAKYEQHIENVFKLTGRKDAAAAAKRVMAFETRLAKASWAPVDLRDVDKTYNPYDVAGAMKATPGIDWAHWLDAMGIQHDQLIVGQPSYFRDLGKALGEVPLGTWKDYLKLRVIDDFSPYLSKAFVEENFDFYGRTLSGTPQLKPRWKRGLDETENAMGDLLGKEYVKRHFPPEAKQRMDALVANLIKAFAVSIDELDWMGPETKKQAHDKISNFTVKIGYPEKWKTYPGLVVQRDDLVGNVQRAREVNVKRQLAKLGKPVDKTEWYMTPQTVNAYYNPLANEIVFPAAILQPPFFDMKADDAVNYGGIGAVIGHEISHGFDDQGRKFDGKGVLRDWWTAEDNQRFMARANLLVKQYDAFSPLPGMNVNGQLTLGENIGDLSGVAVAYKAYQIALAGKPAPVLDGYTGDQRFFLGWGQIWARKYRDDELRKRLKTDPHSPSEYRSNGILRNMPAFQQAFDVKPGDQLYLPPEQIVRIW
jgi:putative endopeptidase